MRFRKRFLDIEHYPAITAYLKAEEETGGIVPGGHGREVDICLPKAIAAIIAAQKPGEILSYLVAYFDHPETYKLYRLKDLIMLVLSREPPSMLISWHWGEVPDDEMRCFGVPYYLATILYRDFPKSDKKEDWITYCNGLRVWGIVPL